MKVLITGSTASQYSSKSNERIPTFTGFIYNSLVETGHTVVWEEPSVETTKDYLNQYDKIIVGLSSPSSLSANKIYGALSVINYAKELDKLVLLVDAPEPYKIWSGIRAISNKPLELVKPFHARRYEYINVLDTNNQERLTQTVVDLYKNEWPTTLYPSNPWIHSEVLTKNIPNLNLENIHGLCFDSFVLQDIPRFNLNYEDYWCVDQPNTKWSKNVAKTLSKPVLPIRDHKWQGHSDALARLDSSLGMIISVYKNSEPWWSVMLSHALLLEIPVVTEWRNTSFLGSDWSLLPSEIEEMGPQERNQLAKRQKNIYLSQIPNVGETLKKVENSVLDARKLVTK
jgi:hypothetical protein